MLRSSKVATPAVAARVSVPDRVPPPGCVPIPIVTVPVNVVTVLPRLSRATTWIAGAIATPAVALDGCVTKASRVDGAAVMSKLALVSGVSPAAVAASV